MFAPKTKEVGVGQRFVTCRTAHPQTWEVEYTYVDAQGIPHARLFDVKFPRTKRTIASATLLDPARFQPA